MKLRNNIIEKLQHSHALRSKIGLLTEKHPMTVQQWVNNNRSHGPLVAWSVLSLISIETGIPVRELIQEEQPVPPKSLLR